jgi:hypothetical protein
VPEVVAHAFPGMAPHSGQTKLMGLMAKIGVCLKGSVFVMHERPRARIYAWKHDPHPLGWAPDAGLVGEEQDVDQRSKDAAPRNRTHET